jgi:hypothetical protein
VYLLVGNASLNATLPKNRAKGKADPIAAPTPIVMAGLVE